MMSDESSDEQEDGLSKYYKFETEDEKQAYDNERADYFSKVQALIPRVAATKAKFNNITEELKKKVKSLQEQLKERQKQQADENKNASKQQAAQQSQGESKRSSDEENIPEDLMVQDLQFCQLALEEGKTVGAQIDNSKQNLETIVATQEKRSYRAIVDIALVPLPSDRAKNNDKNKDNDKNKGNDKDKNQEKDKTAGQGKNTKLSAKNLAGLRNGIPLEMQNKEAENEAPQKPSPQNSNAVVLSQLRTNTLL